MRSSYFRRAAGPPDGEKPAGGARLLRLVLLVLLLAWMVRSFVAAPFSIPSASMLPNLYAGDYVIVSKWPYGYSRYSFPLEIPAFDGRLIGRLPERGDVVVFRSNEGKGDFVKRVVGLPGDRIGVEGGTLLVNGRAITRLGEGFAQVPISANSPCEVVAGATAQISSDGSACRYPAYRETLENGASWRVLDQVDRPSADHFQPVEVPEGHLFLMGDNRDDSLDSRFSPKEGGLGFVPLDHLIGRADFIFWSTDGTADYWKPWTWFTALRSGRIGPVGREARQ